ncbi:MAG: magnesium transporter, partial [Candidatus Omnitrophota bacterium]
MTNKDNDNVRILMLFMPEIRQCLENKRWPELKQILLKIPPMDLAEGWGNFSPRERIIIFKLFDIRLATELFESLRLEDQSFLLNNLEDGNVARILNDMAPDERANLFKDLPRKVYKKFFRLMSKEEAADVAELLAYDEGAAGAVMTTEFVELRKDMTARGAILKLQDCLRFDSSADVHTVYVTDENNILKGAVELQDLIKAPADMPIKDIMTDVDHIKIGVDNANAEVARRFKKYDLLDAPVVDVSDKLIGVITVDDIVDLIDKEATKDIYEVGKMSAEEGQIISYATATVGELLKRRSGWLIFLLVF